MRVLQVVTLISPDGAYGGPTRVAFNQASALMESGVEVDVCAGTRGYVDVPRELYGVPVHLFGVRRLIPRTGFAGLTSPGLALWFIRYGRHYDVVHVHLARDLVSAMIAALAVLLRINLHVQTHGMIDDTTKRLAKPLDAFVIRPILRRAISVFYLTEREHSDLLAIEPAARLVELRNGVPAATAPPEDHKSPNGVEPLRILYVARLQRRKRPEVLVEAAIMLLRGGFKGEFTFVGPDEGSAAALEALIESSGYGDSICWVGAVDPSDVLAYMQDADLYVLPSVDEPFPMSVLEAMAAGLPVIITDTCGLAGAVTSGAAGVVVDSTTSALIAAIRGYGDDPAKLAEHSENALALVDREFSMRGIVARLLARYESGYEKVEWLDAAFAGSHVLVAAGPYDLPTADVVVDDLQRFAAGETGRRLRFTPVPMTRKWRRNPDAQVNVVASVPAEHESRWAAAQVGDQRLAVFSGFAAGLGSMPVTILLDGQYAYLRLDHGLGDALLDYGILATVGSGYPFGSGRPGHAETGRTPENVAAGRRAGSLGSLLRMARPDSVSPGLVEGAVPMLRMGGLAMSQVVRALRRRRQNVVADVRQLSADDVAVVGHICGGQTTVALHGSTRGMPSRNSMVCSALVSGFGEATVPLGQSVSLLVDLRRYLRRGDKGAGVTDGGAEATGNMACIIGVPTEQASDPGTLDAAVAKTLRSGTPALRAAVASVRVMLGVRAGGNIASPESRDIQLVISNVAGHPLAERAWGRAADSDHRLYTATTLRQAQQVSLFVTFVGGRYMFTAAFHDDVVDAERVKCALVNAEQRILRLCGDGP